MLTAYSPRRQVTGTRRALVAGLMLVGLGLPFADAAAPTAPPAAGLETLADIDTLPIWTPGVRAQYVSSHDRTGGNNDGFSGKYSALYVDENGEHVIFEHEGPGCVYTFWFTGPAGGHSKLP